METVSFREIRRLNEAAGHHFFESATIRFFRSRIAREAFKTRDGTRAYFVTSEQFIASSGEKSPRRYTVRRVVLSHVTDDNVGHVNTVGKFQQWRTHEAAENEAKRLALSLVDESTSSLRSAEAPARRSASRESTNAMPAFKALVKRLGRPIGDHS